MIKDDRLENVIIHIKFAVKRSIEEPVWIVASTSQLNAHLNSLADCGDHVRDFFVAIHY